jgi:hypothetical protein
MKIFGEKEEKAVFSLHELHLSRDCVALDFLGGISGLNENTDCKLQRIRAKCLIILGGLPLSVYTGLSLIIFFSSRTQRSFSKKSNPRFLTLVFLGTE